MSGFNNRNVFSDSSEGLKSKIKVTAGPCASNGAGKDLFQAFLPASGNFLVSGSIVIVFRGRSPVCMSKFSLFYKDISHICLGPTLMASLYLDYF